MAIVFDGEKQVLKSITCYCQGHCPHGEEYGTCDTQPGGKCFTAVELDVDDDGKEYPILSYGCLPPNEMALFQCRAKLVASRDNKNIQCCDEYDFCNKHLLPVIPTTQETTNADFLHSMTLKVLITSLSISFVIFTIVLVLTFIKHRRKEKLNHEMKKTSGQVETGKAINISNVNNVLNFPADLNGANSNINLRLETSQSKYESEYELPGLVQRTISKQLQLGTKIASGRYGEVWNAKWRGEKVAVKIFSPSEEQQWLREIEIYQTVLMRHDNILGFIAADIKGNGPESQMIVITEYHERGCLSDFLNTNTVSPMELLKIAKGISSGLNHLHNEIFGCKGKPAIAHNNINSRNILVKRNKECCLGDFKKAAKFFTTRNQIDVPSDSENSDIRYLAPELLEKKCDKNNFECYKMTDIYSFSLVLWEIANRCHVDPLVTDSKYQFPYDEELASRSLSWDDLVEVVAINKTRPVLKKEWESNPILKTLSKIMGECWSPNPSVRLTSLRIKKNLFKMYSENSG